MSQYHLVLNPVANRLSLCCWHAVYAARPTSLSTTQVEKLARQFGVAEDVAYTCETAAHFWLLHVLSRWEKFLAQVQQKKTSQCVKVQLKSLCMHKPIFADSHGIASVCSGQWLYSCMCIVATQIAARFTYESILCVECHCCASVYNNLGCRGCRPPQQMLFQTGWHEVHCSLPATDDLPVAEAVLACSAGSVPLQELLCRCARDSVCWHGV